jgi:hypothetical protein
MSRLRAGYGALCSSFALLVLAPPAFPQADSNTDAKADLTAETYAAALADTSELDAADECMVAQICIDRYLWSLYARTPKLDSLKVPEVIKITVKRKGKMKVVRKTIFKVVDEDFTWKDVSAAQKVGMSLKDYVIGGMDAAFRVTLYHALRAVDDAGLMPGITSAFRDDYRQMIASGQKASSDRSYHGGSFRGGYGHGLAADIVSVKGETRAQRWVSTEEMWKWLDVHVRELGIGRPYGDRDGPHVGPIDGQEYIAHHGPLAPQVADAATESDAPQAEAKTAVEARKVDAKAKPQAHHAEAKKTHHLHDGHNDHSGKRARAARSSKVKSG